MILSKILMQENTQILLAESWCYQKECVKYIGYFNLWKHYVYDNSYVLKLNDNIFIKVYSNCVILLANNRNTKYILSNEAKSFVSKYMLKKNFQ